MTTTRRALRACVVLAGVVVSVLLGAGPALAGIAGDAGAGQSASTLSWSATLVRPDGTLLTGSALSGNTGLSLGTSYIYASARNTGTVALTASTSRSPEAPHSAPPRSPWPPARPAGPPRTPAPARAPSPSWPPRTGRPPWPSCR